MPPDPAGRHQSGPPPTPPTPQALPQRPPVPTHNQQRPMAQALPPGGAQAGKPPQVPPPMPPSQPLRLDAQHIPKRPTRVRPGVNVSSQLLTDGHRYMRNTVKAASHLMAPPAAVIISSRNRAWDAMPDCSFAVCLGCVLLSARVAASRVRMLAGIYTLQTTMQYVQLTDEQVLFVRRLYQTDSCV